MRISLGDVNLWFDVSGPSVVLTVTPRWNGPRWWLFTVVRDLTT